MTGCVSLSMQSGYKGPPERPESLEAYYSINRAYSGFQSQQLSNLGNYQVTRYLLQSDFEDIVIDYFHQQRKSENLIFVFPVLGGKNLIENYFADYFTSAGFDTAIVHRSNEFKKPENLGRIEEVFRENVIRDRIAIDFFEKEIGKKKFGSFGISRGAINVAMTAGVDKRLEYNVLVLGGTDLVGMFKESNQPRIQKYIAKATEDRKITRDEFFDILQKSLKTDPKMLASYLDARKTLLFLSALDKTVPFKFGQKLRRQIGKPRTIIMLADHYTSLFYTQMVKLVPPEKNLCVFPFDFVEGEALDFYRESLDGQKTWWRGLPLKILQWPINTVASFWN